MSRLPARALTPKQFAPLRRVLRVGGPAAHSSFVAAGPGRGFEEFFAVEYPRLLRVLTAADATADDALQEAFTRAAVSWRRVSKYDDPAGWVRLVAVRRMLDERRSERRKHAALARLDASVAIDDADADAALDLAAAIDQLPKQQRVALALFYVGGLTSTEVGDAMGISAGAVRFHLHEARNRLRTMLEVHDD